MAILDTLLGNSSRVDVLEHDPALADQLLDDEVIEAGFRLLRDYVAFTARRIIVADKQGVTGLRHEYLSIPYRRVAMFSVQTKAPMEHHAVLLIHVQGLATPVELSFTDNETLLAVARGLTHLVCRAAA